MLVLDQEVLVEKAPAQALNDGEILLPRTIRIPPSGRFLVHGGGGAAIVRARHRPDDSEAAKLSPALARRLAGPTQSVKVRHISYWSTVRHSRWVLALTCIFLAALVSSVLLGIAVYAKDGDSESGIGGMLTVAFWTGVVGTFGTFVNLLVGYRNT